MDKGERLTVFVAFEVELWRGARHWAGITAIEQFARAGQKVYLFTRPVWAENPIYDFLRNLGVQILIPNAMLRRSSYMIRYGIKFLLLIGHMLIHRQSLSAARKQLSSDDGRYIEYLWLSRCMSRYARLGKPDVVHCFGATQWTATAIEWAFQRDIPAIYTETLEARHEIYTALLKSFIDKCTVITLHGQKLINEFHQLGYRGDLQVIPFGIPDPAGTVLDAKQEKKEAVTIGCAARFDRMKALNHLIDAAAILKVQFPEVRLYLAGNGPDRQRLIEQTARLGLTGSVVFAPPYRVDDGLASFMSQIDIYCQSSLVEGQPISVIEAMAYGKPVVATNVGSVAELLADGAGIVVNPGDSTELAAALSELIRDKRLRDKISENGRQRYLARHQASNTGKQYLELYRTVLEQSLTQKTTLVYFQQNIAFGSCERYLQALAVSMSQLQCKIWLVYPDHPDLKPFQEVVGNGVNILTYPSTLLGRNSIYAIRELLALFRKLRPDIAHFNDPCVNGILAARLAGVSVRVMTYNVPELNRWYSWKGRLLEWAAFRSVTHTIFDSERNRQMGAKRNGLPRAKSTAIHHGLPHANSRKPFDERIYVRQELDIPLESRVVVNIGRLSIQKGQNYLIEAARQVVDRHPGAIFLVAGEGELRTDLERQIANAGLNGRFRLIGYRDDIQRVLAACDIFALPSNFEGLPYALLHAMESGLPVVATAVGGVPEAVADNVSGRLIPPRNPAKLAEAILWLLDHPQQAHAMGLEGRRRFESDFTLERMVKQTERLYRKLLSTGSLRRADI